MAMKRVILGAYLCTLVIAGSYAQSVQGSDWSFDMAGSFFIPSLGFTQPVNLTGQPVNITQAGNDPDDGYDDFLVPLSIPPYLSTTLDGGFFTIMGNPGVKIYKFDPGPFNFTLGTIPVRLSNVTLHLAGLITGVNPAIVDAFGPRVYYIYGLSTTSPWSQHPDSSWGLVGLVEANFGFGWQNLGPGQLSFASWQLYRPIPEPASMLALASGLAGLIALRRRKR